MKIQRLTKRTLIDISYKEVIMNRNKDPVEEV